MDFLKILGHVVLVNVMSAEWFQDPVTYFTADVVVSDMNTISSKSTQKAIKTAN